MTTSLYPTPAGAASGTVLRGNHVNDVTARPRKRRKRSRQSSARFTERNTNPNNTNKQKTKVGKNNDHKKQATI